MSATPMSEYDLTESAEEVLARLWVAKEEQDRPSCPVGELGTEDRERALAQLLESGLVEREADVVSLTHSGEVQAESITRRERLAERLLTDVLNLGEAQAAEAACQFEHHLRRGIDDEICTLLGHPRVCPHGSPIPPGECCRAGTRSAGKVISALADMTPGQAGVIAYIHATRREMMERLLAMGAVPGSSISLLQRSPSYVFQLGEAQIAVDRETAQDVYVRITGQRPAQSEPGQRWRLRRGRGRR
jgi:DtxR family Mn-dependent transcriptional regulator